MTASAADSHARVSRAAAPPGSVPPGAVPLSPRRLRRKIMLLAVLPLLAALLLIALAVHYQARDLASRERAMVEQAYMASKEAEIRNYVEQAMSMIRPLYDTGRDDEAIKSQAKDILRALTYGGGDGYFFAYEYNGLCLVLPPQPELVGQNLWEIRDRDGRPVVQSLVAKAREGSGYFRYVWNKPSVREVAPKLGYVVGLDRWGWMLGTGLYLDDIQSTLDTLDRQANAHIDATMAWIVAIALLAVGLVGGSALALNLSEYRAADAQLQMMARQLVHTQEGERAHLSRELHDSTGQTLVSVKLLMDSAIQQYQRDASAPGAATALPHTLERARARLNDAISEVRDISHRLRPAELDTLGLPAALRQLGEEFAAHADLAFFLRERGPALELPEEIKTVLFRITQEALTNIEKHAKASRVDVRLVSSRAGVRLSVGDDGRGFEVAELAHDPRRGIGLRNMQERLAAVGGRLRLVSMPGSTRVIAEIPLAMIRRFALGASGASHAELVADGFTRAGTGFSPIQTLPRP
jgi:two-component system, NarL family, sensor kinase